MKWFIKYVALALLALWVPATLHCDLEAIGAFASAHENHTANDGCCDTHSLCSAQGCELVENGAYPPTATGFKPLVPDVLVRVSFALAQLAAFDSQARPVLRVRPASGPPLDWLSRWQFVRRAAPPARAPGLFV